MKRSLVLAIMLASGIVLSAAAQTSPAPAAPAGPAKIAVIAFQVAVGQTNEGQRNFADLQKKYAPREEQLKSLNDEVETLTKQLQAQGDKLSDVERASKAKTIDDKKKLAQRFAEDAQNDFNRDRDETINRIGVKMVKVINEYASQNGFALILDDAQIPIYFASKDIEVTADIVKLYDAANPVADAGVPAKPATHPTPPVSTPKPQ